MAIPSEQALYHELCRRHGEAVQEKLKAARVAIAGLGGLGSTIAIALARAGVGHLHLVDFDAVDLSNINRQQYTLSDIGQPKTQALARHIAEINPYLDVSTTTKGVTEENAHDLFLNETIICEAFDRPEAKAMLVNAYIESFSEKYLVGASGMAGYGDSNTICTRKMTSRYYLCGDGISGLENTNGLMAPRVGICAGHQANMIVRLILEKEAID